ncbi:amino acid ABC transporter ATP-binding protein [Serratia fonticola]|uniref:Amino acid ABC transporter ATP-binding protein n=1 Tax=Serratia fonticola TaxID=47917 RepID=A0AAJ2DCH2_SERFO|nr:amino acid ABC transporter ATP-binding protein [Serratia fonticola]MDQ9130224.1 amino acid ABC transporter ATP-binding protein [Serratia fonticola]
MIEVSGLEKYYAGNHVLKGIDFHIQQSETVAIIGPSGSGKSTLIRCLNLLEKPSAGTIRIAHQQVHAEALSKRAIHDLRQYTGMVFQSFNLFPHLTALENVTQGLITVQRKPRARAQEEGMHFLTKVGMAAKAQSYPAQLSGGQQQRVAIARTLAMQPKVVLMDEPTSALDPELVHEVLQVIRAIAQEAITTIIVTHELRFAQEVADRVMFIDGGKIVEFAPPAEIFQRPKQPRTALFLGKFLEAEYAI